MKVIEQCGNCGSFDGVKLNSIAVGRWGVHEYLCRACRFDASVYRRSAPCRTYSVEYMKATPEGLAVAEKTVTADSSGNAISNVRDEDPDYVRWTIVYQKIPIRVYSSLTREKSS